MIFFRYWLLTVLVYIPWVALAPTTAAAGTLYNMDYFLREPHPFAVGVPPEAPPTVPTAIPVEVKPPEPRVAQSSSTRMPADKVSNRWLSEIRGGILKHAVSLVGNQSKETGVDGNLEILFNSPEWLGFLWSPRPHFGASFNASALNTDVAYTGLTWEWRPLKALFFNFSFGVAVHNGELEYDPSKPFPSDAGRHREFGCRALFRESFELGWIFAKRHAVSAMWSHYSHGGLCGGQNEGLDNLGVRYGYRF